MWVHISSQEWIVNIRSVNRTCKVVTGCHYTYGLLIKLIAKSFAITTNSFFNLTITLLNTSSYFRLDRIDVVIVRHCNFAFCFSSNLTECSLSFFNLLKSLNGSLVSLLHLFVDLLNFAFEGLCSLLGSSSHLLFLLVHFKFQSSLELF